MANVKLSKKFELFFQCHSMRDFPIIGERCPVSIGFPREAFQTIRVFPRGRSKYFTRFDIEALISAAYSVGLVFFVAAADSKPVVEITDYDPEY